MARKEPVRRHGQADNAQDNARADGTGVSKDDATGDAMMDALGAVTDETTGGKKTAGAKTRAKRTSAEASKGTSGPQAPSSRANTQRVPAPRPEGRGFHRYGRPP